MNPCIFFRRFSWCHLFTMYRNVAVESLTFGANWLFSSANKSSKSDQGCPREAKTDPRGYPPEFSKNSSQTKRTTALNCQATVSKTGPQSESLLYLLIYYSMCFRLISGMGRWLFLRWFGINFSIICLICSNAFRISF